MLTEGELDTAAALSHGLRAVATPGMQIKATLAEELGQSVDRVAVVFDVGDDAYVAADRAVGLLRKAGAEAWPVRLPLTAKGADITDFFLSGGTARELVALIRRARREAR